MTLHTQLMTMIVMMISGIYLGFATTTFHRILLIWRHKLIVRYGFEILYWMIQTGVLFYVLYQMNAGEVRLLFGLACLLGYSIYVVLCSFWYEKVLEQIIRMIKLVIRWTSQAIYQLIIRPLSWLIRLLFMFVLSIYRFIVKVLYIIISPLIKLLEKYLPESFLKIISKSLVFCSTIIDKLKDYWKRLSEKWR